ncbi:MAG: hypothetical protein KME12_09650 [Trichocoleus desertorum ATA4-8-CV12]|jgi:hypothetical protein|nr:hypothetical protein [Trichocoleus desertorum ATA4-8-CV12]
MRSKRWASWIVGVALVGGSCFAGSAHAQINNQSDTSGTNVFNNTAPRFPTPGLSPDTLATATRLSQELTNARNAYTTTEQEATRVPRRFARGPGGDCVNPALSRLNEAIRASEEFLSGLSSAQVEQLRRTSNLKIW